MRPKTEEMLSRTLLFGGFVSVGALEEARGNAQATGRSLVVALTEGSQRLLTPETVATVLSLKLRVEVVNLRETRPTNEALALVPAGFARKHNILPLTLNLDWDILRVVMEDPTDARFVRQLAVITGKTIIKPVLSLYGKLGEAIWLAYLGST